MISMVWMVNCMLVVATGVLVVVFAAVGVQRRSILMLLAAAIGGPFFIILLLSGYLQRGLVGLFAALARAPEEPRSPKPAPVPARHTDWNHVGHVGEIVALTLVVVLAVVLAVVLVWVPAGRLRQRRRTRRAQLRSHADEAARQWKAALDTEARVLDRVHDYETDLDLVLRFPLMRDLDEPAMVRLVNACARARDLRPGDGVVPQVPPGQAAADLAYPSAVREMEVAFEAAESKARRVAQDRFSPAERVILRRARAALATANDDGATPAERRTAYAAVLRLLEGLVEVPAKAAAAIESRVGHLVLES